MEHGFLQFTASSPCFLWNQQAPGGVENLEDGAGVEDRLDRGALGGQAREETAFTSRESSKTPERRFMEEEEIRLW